MVNIELYLEYTPDFKKTLEEMKENEIDETLAIVEDTEKGKRYEVEIENGSPVIWESEKDEAGEYETTDKTTGYWFFEEIEDYESFVLNVYKLLL